MKFIKLGHYKSDCGELVYTFVKNGWLGNPTTYARYNFIDHAETNRLASEAKTALEARYQFYKSKPKQR